MRKIILAISLFLVIFTVNAQEIRCINIFFIKGEGDTTYNQETVSVVLSTSTPQKTELFVPLVPGVLMIERALSKTYDYLIIGFKADGLLLSTIKSFKNDSISKVFELPMLAFKDEVPVWKEGKTIQNIPPGINFLQPAIVGQYKNDTWMIIICTGKTKMSNPYKALFHLVSGDVVRLFFAADADEFLLKNIGR
jgi:hypothetical protein